MTSSIFRSLKGLSAAAVVLAIPVFAAVGLMAAGWGRQAVPVAAEHDSIMSVAKQVGTPRWLQTSEPPVFGSNDIATAPTVSQVDMANWSYTAGRPGPSCVSVNGVCNPVGCCP